MGEANKLPTTCPACDVNISEKGIVQKQPVFVVQVATVKGGDIEWDGEDTEPIKDAATEYDCNNCGNKLPFVNGENVSTVLVNAEDVLLAQRDEQQVVHNDGDDVGAGLNDWPNPDGGA